MVQRADKCGTYQVSKTLRVTVIYAWMVWTSWSRTKCLDNRNKIRMVLPIPTVKSCL